MIQFVIPLPPVTKKNSQQIITPKGHTKPIIIPSRAFLQYQDSAGYFLKPYEIDKPVNIKCLFYMPTRRKCDLTNLLEAADDVMVHYSVIKDDHCGIAAAHDGSRVLYDKDNPRTEIYITYLGGENA